MSINDKNISLALGSTNVPGPYIVYFVRKDNAVFLLIRVETVLVVGVGGGADVEHGEIEESAGR